MCSAQLSKCDGWKGGVSFYVYFRLYCSLLEYAPSIAFLIDGFIFKKGFHLGFGSIHVLMPRVCLLSLDRYGAHTPCDQRSRSHDCIEAGVHIYSVVVLRHLNRVYCLTTIEASQCLSPHIPKCIKQFKGSMYCTSF